MNRAVWDALTVRERDAVVAEKIMGWRVQWRTELHYDFSKTERLYYWHPYDDPTIYATNEVPLFTTSWDAMCEVVEKAKDWRITMDGGEYHGDSWEVKIVTNDGCFFADAPTLPEAVCVAALTALGHMEAA